MKTVDCHIINILASLKWAVELDSTNEGKNFHMIEAAHKSAQEILKLLEKWDYDIGLKKEKEWK